MNATDIALSRTFYGKDLIQERFAYVGSGAGTGQVEYSGIAKRGRATSDAAWWVFKYTYDSNDRVTAIQVAPQDSVWDNRTNLTYA